VRLIGIPFAVIGAIVTVIGLVSIRHEGIRGFGPDARLGGFGYLFIAFTVVIMGRRARRTTPTSGSGRRPARS
jgi:hypothetical protein